MQELSNREPANSLDKFDLAKDGFTLWLINRKVQQLVQRPGFDVRERKDLTQDILLRVVKGMALYDSNIGHRNPFIQTMVERQVANIIRERVAEKRSSGFLKSLNVTIRHPDLGPTELINAIGDQEQNRRLGRDLPRSHEEQCDLRDDLAAAIATMPKETREILERLKTQNLSEVARDMRIPRSTLKLLLDQVREQFEEAGLSEYFER